MRIAIVAAVLVLSAASCSNKPALAPQATGQVFTERCVICHQSNAQGIAGMYPPLADSIGYYVREPGGRQYLVHVLLNGLSGPLDVKGTTYNGLMPQFASLSDDDVAEALNEVLERYNSNELPPAFQPITPDEVHNGRALHETPSQLKDERTQIFDELKSVGDAK